MTWLDYLTESTKTIVEVPYKSGERFMIATENSEFKQTLGSVYAYNKDSPILYTVPKSMVWYIDNNRVSRETFEDTIKRLELMIYSKTKRRCAWKTLNGSDGVTVWKIKEPVCFENVSSTDNDSYKRYHDDYYGLGKLQTKIRGKRADCCVYDDCMYIRGSVYAQLNEILNSNKKENEDMVDYKKIKDDIFKEYSTAVNKRFMVRPQIVNYKYNETTGETTVYWDDKTQTTVKADNISEASQFEGFCAACAKKLFGNKSTYLNQFDKWTVKIPARQKAEAEKKAAEDKAREEARAKRAAKKAERKRKRDIELRAKQLADMYYSQEIEDEANKIANEKYGVPTDWLNN